MASNWMGIAATLLFLAPLACSPAAQEGGAGAKESGAMTEDTNAAAGRGSETASRAESGAGSAGALAAASSRFALDLYQALARADARGSFFFSPHSISTALAMTRAGAVAATAAEMDAVLHFPVGEAGEDLHRSFAALDDSLAARAKEQDGPELAVANRLWGQRGLSWQAEFLATCRAHYGAGFAEVDFGSDPDGVRRNVNAWCAEQTRDRIRDLLAPGTVDRLTALILTNAIYFKGTWKQQFDPKRTQDGPFHLAGGGEAQVPFMHTKATYGYREEPSFQALEMPYAGDDLSLVVLLPKERDGLAALEAELDAERLGALLGELREEEVVVTFPRFTFSSQFSLAETLAAMGMPTAFTERADFSAMCAGPEPIWIGAVIHKAFVEVNEEGTEAAAATAVTMTRATALPRTTTFVADHPFVFLIRDRVTGAVLFLGRMADPRG